MGWIGPKGEDIPPHPRQEPRFEGDLTADHIRFIFRDCADFGERVPSAHLPVLDVTRTVQPMPVSA